MKSVKAWNVSNFVVFTKISINIFSQNKLSSSVVYYFVLQVNDNYFANYVLLQLFWAAALKTPKDFLLVIFDGRPLDISLRS